MDIRYLLDSTFEVEKTFGISREYYFLKSALSKISLSYEKVLPLGISQNSSFGSKLITFVQISVLRLLGRDKTINLDSRTVFFQPQLMPIKPKGGYLAWIIRVHDLFPIENPNWFKNGSSMQFKRGFELANSFGAYFVANSDYTRDCLIREGVVNSRIAVVGCLVKKPSSEPCGHCKVCRQGIPIREYALAVGTIEPRKNYIKLIKAWEEHSTTQIDLIIVGDYGWKQSQIESITQKTGFYGRVCDASLDKLYEGARIFVSSSLDEGFDIPYHEANSYGLPLLVSNIPVHRNYPERSFLFNPSTFDHFSTSLEKSLRCKKNDQSWISEAEQIEIYSATIQSVVRKSIKKLT
jgi:glycosyltransferase involved in cell wall biosynthesis